MLFITEEEVRRLLPMTEAVRLMRETFDALAAGTAINQPRRRLILPTGSVLHQLAGATAVYFGTKYYAANLKHGVYFFFHLFDSETAKPLALIEANFLGQIRTGAVSGYATDLLARPDASVVAVIGSGFQARSQIEAIRCVRSIREVRVWSRNAANREAFAAETGAVNCASAEEAVRGCDILVTATYSKDSVVKSEWVLPGTHINAMGSNHAQRREIPADLLARASVVAVDSIEQARIEAGDLLLAWNEQDWQSPRLVELPHAKRTAPDQITLFKSLGLGVEDVAAGGYVYERATSSS
jgi:ornithine cyclodeaminase/alanine dehydrogenase-like protein (mu-crystallin family)